MKRTIIFLAFLVFPIICSASKVNVEQVASSVATRGRSFIDPRHYAGTVYTQALAEMYKASGNDEWLSLTEAILDKFESGECQGYGSFISYSIGGTAAPELAWYGVKKYWPMQKPLPKKCLSSSLETLTA